MDTADDVVDEDIVELGDAEEVEFVLGSEEEVSATANGDWSTSHTVPSLGSVPFA